MKDKKEKMLTSIRFWLLSEGYEEITKEDSLDVVVAQKRNQKTTFITEFDKSKDELIESISNTKSDYIYVVTDDNAKRRELVKIIPDYCGILCHSNPFGLGMLTQILKEPKFKEVL